MASGNAPAIETGPEVQEVETEHLGFKVLAQGKAGPKKVKILPPWPANQLPSTSATLLSISSKQGLLAAAGPGTLIVTSTAGVRKAYQNQTLSETITDASDSRLEQRDLDVVSDFTVDLTLDVPTLRHVVFSVDGDFLVISAEDGGGLAVFATDRLKAGDKNPKLQIDTEKTAIRALQPNPEPTLAHYYAAVLENGRLIITDVDSGKTQTIKDSGVSCVAWSTRGKAVVAGLQDGSVAILMSDGTLKGVVPRPPDVDESFAVTGLSWLNNDEFFIIHSVKQQDPEDAQDSKYHYVKSNKGWTSFSFREFVWDPIAPSRDGIPRALPPRFSAMRLRNWQPDLEDMLIVTNSHTDAIVVFASTSQTISPDQANCNELMLVSVEDAKKAAVPRTVYGEDTDSIFVGEALDLSSTEKIRRPIPALEEIEEAPWPLPAYMALTHEGVLASWWIVWNRSIEAGTRYPGLVFDGTETDQASTTPAKPTPQAGSLFGQSSTPASKIPQAFSKPLSTFGTPPSSQPGNTGFGFGSTTPSTLMKPTPPGFGTPGFGSTTPAFGKPAQPAFGAPSSIGKPAQPAFGAPLSIGKPAFGAPSAIGAPGGFGGGFESKPSPWGAPQASQSQSNPFSAAASGSSGFAKFGQTGATGGSTFSSFGSNNGTQSGFGSLGQGQQKPGFAGLKPEPSFGSTVTVDSGAGSTLPSWANTPAQNGSIFGQNNKSSFNTASFESKESDMSDVNESERRQRDEATPTPQNPTAKQADKPLFGLAGGFKLGTTFSSDGTAKDDPAKPAAPANGSFFGSDFSNMLGSAALKPPATPLKETPENGSTTPASPPKQQSLFASRTPAKDSETPKAAPPAKESSTPVDDAPLPPDFTKAKPSNVNDAPLPPDFINAPLPKSNKKDLPPLAGSPGIKVEAPNSSPDASPLDDDEEDFSDEEDEASEGEDDEEGEGEDEDDEEEEESSPPNETSKLQPSKSAGWTLHDSVGPSPRVFPPAPTPPIAKSGATSQSGRSASPAQSTLFGQPSQPAASQPAYAPPSLFDQSAQQNGPFSYTGSKQTATSSMAPRPNFPPPKNRTGDLRSPSPVRSASTSAMRARREPFVAPGASLSASMQQAKPPTPQPQVSDLEDEEDERMRERLGRPIEPTRTLDEFVAYQNYTGSSPSKTGHAAQIEMIYKDINGMVDALGWNARSIKSFTQYHKEPQSGHHVDHHTLEDVQDEGQDGSWFERFTMCEIEALRALENELEQELDAGRVQDVLGKLAQLARLLREKAKLMTRLNDIRRQIITRKDPEKTQALRNAPLPKEIADSQKALRNDYAQLLISLHKAEEAASILRSKVVSHNAANGKTGAVPTVENVKKTVLKLTAMTEKRNNDILLLESQLRKIGLAEPSRPSSAASRTQPQATPRRGRDGHGASLRNSIADTPFATPPTRSTLSLREINRRALTPEVDASPTPTKGYGLFYTPEGSPTPGKELARLGDLVDENIDTLRLAARRRREVAKGLKRALGERGVKMTTVG
ncbi:hypothetical protein T440DRAFT_459198 [Plenodomus tracheiphilus IPT5]|uniref:Nucleoporin Nup159/Nup146 N-terminal domain-containing protein n=1 Tax=Plenodomus tracheiphilus IPT5 TaxID=1408161 RepID=A0A6A7AS16_9PLEO|nr:hypothetical protein T440DRAFT_459198 [Plenodomus tracheiphilus IPT5]